MGKKKLSVEQIVKDLKASDLYLNFKIPMGYVSGFPVLQIKNDSLCVTIPYLKYQTTGEIDKTLVFPVRYAITLELPTLNLVAYENYEYKEAFKNIVFDKPVGYFRHDAIKKYNKAQYKELREELMKLYDKLINALLDNGDYTTEDEKKMAELLQLLIEPSLVMMYRAIDEDFYNKYLMKR